SCLYRLSLSLRHFLYHFGLFHRHRLPVPVISVGNLTWGGNGKTPMVEFISRFLCDSGIVPLILTRGYAGGDEVRMLRRKLLGTPTKIGIGAKRVAVATHFIDTYGYVNPQKRSCINGACGHAEGIGAIVLDDGMQHLSLWRDVEIVMVNGMMPWGNHHLIPLGPLREHLTALQKADIAIIHHADLISKANLGAIVTTLQSYHATLPVFFSTMAPSHFFLFGDENSKITLKIIENRVVLCVSAIGFPDAFVKGIEKMGPLHVDRLDFIDHHSFRDKDIEMIIGRLEMLESKFNSKPFLVVTEKDYDRDSEIFTHVAPFDVLILRSQLQIITQNGQTAITFQNLLMDHLGIKLSGICQTSLEFPYHPDTSFMHSALTVLVWRCGQLALLMFPDGGRKGH
ncbi:Tetraacyldisaccharide 4'-kinase, partial [Dillenia turbinata]